MFIRIDFAGKVLELDKSSWIDIDWDVEHGCIGEIVSGNECIRNVRICIDENELKYVAPPAYYRGELLCTSDFENIYIR